MVRTVSFTLPHSPLPSGLQSAGKCLEVMGQHMHLGTSGAFVPPVPVLQCLARSCNFGLV
jgi:hypothetical protein